MATTSVLSKLARSSRRADSSFQRPAGFDRVAGEVLEHLLLTSPLAQWLVVRFRGDERQSLRIVKSAGDAYVLTPELDLSLADLSATLAGRLVRLPESSQLSQQLGARWCIAAAIGQADRGMAGMAGTVSPYGAIVGLDSVDPALGAGPTLPEGFAQQLRLHASHLEGALRSHRNSFIAEHGRIADHDEVNGFDTPAAWSDRVQLIDRHCAAIGDDASIAVIDIDGLAVMKQQFGYLAAEELLREISFVLRSLSLPEAYFARLSSDRMAVLRIGIGGFDSEYWANDLRAGLNLAIASSSTATMTAVRCRVGVATRTWGQRRALEQAQNRAAKQTGAVALRATPERG